MIEIEKQIYEVKKIRVSFKSILVSSELQCCIYDKVKNNSTALIYSYIAIGSFKSFCVLHST